MFLWLTVIPCNFVDQMMFFTMAHEISRNLPVHLEVIAYWLYSNRDRALLITDDSTTHFQTSIYEHENQLFDPRF